MCGIVGVAARAPVVDRAWLRVGRDRLAHRGPDSAGEWWSHDGRVGFGHRRLAILDLTTAANQPMHQQDDLVIVFNGEIYNFVDLRVQLEAKGHVFRTRSDTEVILVAYREWGLECPLHLNGMFAFAIHDTKRQHVFLARDRVGEKPLFIWEAEGELRFGSELKALIADPRLPRKIEPTALSCLLGLGYVPGDLCILEGFAKLPPAHALLFELNGNQSRSWRYWQLPDYEGGAPTEAAARAHEGHVAALVDELDYLLLDAVRNQSVADVPVGVLLSGGVDSSLVTAMACRSGKHVKTFTVSFPGQQPYDESKHARLVASHFGTDHTEHEADPFMADVLPELARQFDEPIMDSSMVPTYFVSRTVRQGCTVALGGDGGDELFGGYRSYRRLLTMASCAAVFPRWVRRRVAWLAERNLPIKFKGRRWLMDVGIDFATELPTNPGPFGSVRRRELMPGLECHVGDADAVYASLIPTSGDPVQRATRTDFHGFLPEDILVKVDRASMHTSLEVRAPMLDYRIIEFAFAKVPSHLKTTRREAKILLKLLAKRHLPHGFDLQRKQGFAMPLREWLRDGPFRDLFWSVLLDSSCHFDRSVVDGLLREFDRGRPHVDQLFALVMFELWRREYRVQM